MKITIKKNIGLTSMWDLEGKTFDVLEVKEFHFSTSTPKYYKVSHNGQEYDIREDFVETVK